MKFLQDSAIQIFSKHALNDLQKVCVVLPTRRAVFYFKRELAELSEIPFISPDVFAIDDFVMQMSSVRLIDNISLIFEFYEVFKEIDKDLDFDRFVGWGTTLLKDFDLIDQYLVENPKSLFDYMSDAKAIARWGKELENIGKELTRTSVSDAYFKLFSNINLAYNNLQNKLIVKGLAYRGMAYRLLANDVETLLLEKEDYTKYYFVGLNALSNSEEKIIAKLVKAQLAETFWDSDDYYMNSNHKAGSVLRRYRNSGVFGDWNWQTDNLNKDAKEMRVIGLQTNSLQAKTTGEIYAEAIAKNPGQQTVIVLANEQLLEPMLGSLDESVDSFNITMGLSLKQSLLTTLVNALFELQANVVEFQNKKGDLVKIPKFSHRHIHKILNHPFVRRYELIKYELDGDSNPIRKTLRHITKNNLVYLSEKEMLDLGENDPIFTMFFKRWNGDVTKALQNFYELVDVLRSVYKSAPDAIEIEYLYLFLTILNRLDRIISQHNNLSVNNFRHFLNELIKAERIPFSGEPIADLQIMSMLETRCLDFDHVIVTSLNEGMLPSSNRNNSLIPYDAAIEFGLPVYRNQDAVMSYHFFRLMQRAKKIDLLYLQPSGGGVGGGNEPSRFILQIENELLKANPSISYLKLDAEVTAQETVAVESEIVIPKSEEILKKLTNYLTNKGLYPSSLNDYLGCSLRFYFKKIANLSQRETVDEKVGADIFGNWLHKTLEAIDKDFTEKSNVYTVETAEQIIKEIPERLDKVYAANFAGIVIERGVNFILKQVAVRVLTNFFKEQIKQGIFPMEVLAYEQTLMTEISVDVNGEIIPVKIAGIIDRIERKDNLISVVDYKTGMVYGKEIKAKDLAEDIYDPNLGKLRQLWLYKYVVSKKKHANELEILKNQSADNQIVEAKIYSFRNLKENLQSELHFETGETPEAFVENSENHLQDIVKSMYDTSVPFQQTDDIKQCHFCDFKGICGKF
ncbi:MAG: PD-(D/E)XK nuclease family protein [Spirosomaceae bacterium]|nr:PD-(D/E)XK nuclease family protein [Spirosomataceae bacterium]